MLRRDTGAYIVLESPPGGGKISNDPTIGEEKSREGKGEDLK